MFYSWGPGATTRFALPKNSSIKNHLTFEDSLLQTFWEVHVSGKQKVQTFSSQSAAQDQQLNAVDVYAFHLYLAWYPTTQPADAEDKQRAGRCWED